MSKAANWKASRGGAKRVRTPEELEFKSTLAAIQEEQEEVGGCDDSDFVIQHMLRNKIALTQSNELDICFGVTKPWRTWKPKSWGTCLAPSTRGRSRTSRR